MSETEPFPGVHITAQLREALYDAADVTFRITAEAAPEEQLTAAVREIWDALWDVGVDGPPGATGETELPAYVGDPVSIAPGVWKLTVDFAHVARAERGGAPEVVAGVLARHAVTPARVDAARLTEEEYRLTTEAEQDAEQPQLFRRRE